MMNEEIEVLREHIEAICRYKGLQQELTYDVSLDVLQRICVALDYLQQENDKLKLENNMLKVSLLNNKRYSYGIRGNTRSDVDDE